MILSKGEIDGMLVLGAFADPLLLALLDMILSFFIGTLDPELAAGMGRLLLLLVAMFRSSFLM